MTMYNKIRNIACMGLLLSLTLPSSAAPRSKSAIMAAAKRTLMANFGRQTQRRMAPSTPLKVLKQNEAFTVVGTKQGGFAIISNDDLVPEVLGYSDEAFNAEQINDNFRWYLEAAEVAIKDIVAKGEVVKGIKPDPTLFQQRVDNFITSNWGQQSPYNNLCPTATKSAEGTWQSYKQSNIALTGCVATAMAQILRYNKYPTKGIGSVTLNVKQADGTSKDFTVDLSQSTYDWRNMRDDYKAKNYTDVEAKAVATLMRDCGFAVKMDYHTDASGSTNIVAAEGLKKHFGYKNVQFYERTKYVSKPTEWMNLVFKELNEKRAILYGAIDPKKRAGHAFVFSGYNEEGKVYVNWGWDGSNNGFYDVSILNPTGYEFRSNQSMVIGIAPDRPAKDLVLKLNVTTPGSLKTQITAEQIATLKGVVVTGSLNSTDIKFLRNLAGLDEANQQTPNSIETIDLTGANIVEGGEPYLIENDIMFTTTNNEMPERAFYGCQGLTKIVLPNSIVKIGDGVFGNINSLSEVVVPTGTDKQFKLIDNVLYSQDGTEIIEVMPMASKKLNIKAPIKKIHAYGFAGCQRITDIVLPETIESIGNKAFANCFAFNSIRTYKKIPCKLGKDVFADINKAITPLYVPLFTVDTYKEAAQWQDFFKNYGNLKSFGTQITARNIVRPYGDENGKFGWITVGDEFIGTPEFTCAAVITSKVGTYPIQISKGSVVSDMLFLVPGELTIVKAKAQIKIVNKHVYIADNYKPEFTIEGLKNNETASVLTKQPTFIIKDKDGNVVNDFSKEGLYTVTAYGAEAENYDFEYVLANVMVYKDAAGIETITESDIDDAPYYNLQGVRIEKPTHGVYIHNGKKVVIK
ncbi:C10 family peptidase [Prevotella disiens]